MPLIRWTAEPHDKEPGAILLTGTSEAGSKLTFLLMHPEDLRKLVTRRSIRAEVRRQFKWV